MIARKPDEVKACFMQGDPAHNTRLSLYVLKAGPNVDQPRVKCVPEKGNMFLPGVTQGMEQPLPHTRYHCEMGKHHIRERVRQTFIKRCILLGANP